MNLITLLAASLAAWLPQPSPMQDQGLVTIAESVGHADLDLATEPGAWALAARMRVAARRACGQASDIDLEGQAETRRCVAKAMEQARTAGERLVASATRARSDGSAANAQGAATSRAAPVALHLSEQ